MSLEKSRPAATTIEIVVDTALPRMQASYRSEVQVYALPPPSHPGLKEHSMHRFTALFVVLPYP